MSRTLTQIQAAQAAKAEAIARCADCAHDPNALAMAEAHRRVAEMIADVIRNAALESLPDRTTPRKHSPL